MTQPTETRQVAWKYAETVTEKPVWGHFFSAMSTPSSTDLTVGKVYFSSTSQAFVRSTRTPTHSESSKGYFSLF